MPLFCMANHRKNNVRTPTTATPTSQNLQNNPAEEPKVALPESNPVPAYEGLKWLAYGFIAAISLGLAFTFNGDYFATTWHDISKICDFSVLHEWALFTAPLLLLFLLVILVLRWIIATQCEFELWRRWLRHTATGPEKVTAFVVFPVILGILPAYPNKIGSSGITRGFFIGWFEGTGKKAKEFIGWNPGWAKPGQGGAI